jgi:hypothetical protein
MLGIAVRLSEHLSSLVPHILGSACPDQKIRGDLVQGFIACEFGSGSGYLCDADRHRGVIAVLAWGETEWAAANHHGLERGGERRTELIRHSERVTTCLPEKYTACSIGRCSVHLINSFVSP